MKTLKEIFKGIIYGCNDFDKLLLKAWDKLLGLFGFISLCCVICVNDVEKLFEYIHIIKLLFNIPITIFIGHILYVIWVIWVQGKED